MAARWLAALAGLTLGVAPAAAAEPLFPAVMWTRLAPAASGWSADKLCEADAAARALRSDALLVRRRLRSVPRHKLIDAIERSSATGRSVRLAR